MTSEYITQQIVEVILKHTPEKDSEKDGYNYPASIKSLMSFLHSFLLRQTQTHIHIKLGLIPTMHPDS